MKVKKLENFINKAIRTILILLPFLLINLLILLILIFAKPSLEIGYVIILIGLPLGILISLIIYLILINKESNESRKAKSNSSLIEIDRKDNLNE
ncbi:hypothetical protein [Spiroplasma sp. DGKH1]|uniref:hypothetical protein n=1 Tax=Spiroplasma sp. DGKH1 TaxID=3050074 RepID=UPI0034C666AB